MKKVIPFREHQMRYIRKLYTHMPIRCIHNRKIMRMVEMKICDRGGTGSFWIFWLFWFSIWMFCSCCWFFFEKLMHFMKILKNFACFSDTPQSILIRTITGAQKRWPSENACTRCFHVTNISKQKEISQKRQPNAYMYTQTRSHTHT